MNIENFIANYYRVDENNNASFIDAHIFDYLYNASYFVH